MLGRPRPTIPCEEYAERRQALRSDCRAAGIDGLLAWSMGGSTLDRYANVFYLTNHYDPGNVYPDVRPYFTGFGQSVVVLPVDGPSILVVNQPDWREDLVNCDEVRVCRDLYDGAVQALRDSGLADGRVGLADEERMGLTAYRELAGNLPGAVFERADDLLMRRRRVKSSAELEAMRYASAVSVEIMNAMLAEVAEGRTDGDVVAAGFGVACRLGAQPYEFAMASGPEDGHLWWSRLPSWNWRRPYEPGDVVHPDVYGAVDGYFYDFVRSIVVGGEPSAGQLELLEGAIECIHAACRVARAGNRACDVHAAGKAHLREHGLTGEIDAADQPDDVAAESFGHGIGVGWDQPTITPLDETVLAAGMTLAVEHAVTRPGVGTARYEETLIVTDNEPEIMTAGCSARWW